MSWETQPKVGDQTAQIPHATGRYYQSPLPVSVSAGITVVIVVDTLYAVPFFVPRTATYTSINIEVTALVAGKSARMGIYADSSGVPGALELDAGTVSVASTGAKSIVIAKELAAGWHWLVIVSDGGPTLRGGSNTSPMPWLGYTSGTDVTGHTGWSVAFVYAALPDPFTGGGALMTTVAPRLMLGL